MLTELVHVEPRLAALGALATKLPVGFWMYR
jgi:hypothetical protein